MIEKKVMETIEKILDTYFLKFSELPKSIEVSENVFGQILSHLDTANIHPVFAQLNNPTKLVWNYAGENIIIKTK